MQQFASYSKHLSATIHIHRDEKEAWSGAPFGDYILADNLGQKSQDYGLNIKDWAKRRLKTLYEVYLAVLMVQAEFP